jgi:hypothetical protein
VLKCSRFGVALAFSDLYNAVVRLPKNVDTWPVNTRISIAWGGVKGQVMNSKLICQRQKLAPEFVKDFG